MPGGSAKGDAVSPFANNVVGLVAVAIKPNGAVLAAAGASGMCWRKVFAVDVVGTVVYLVLLHNVAG